MAGSADGSPASVPSPGVSAEGTGHVHAGEAVDKMKAERDGKKLEPATKPAEAKKPVSQPSSQAEVKIEIPPPGYEGTTARVVGAYRPTERRPQRIVVPRGLKPSPQTGVDLYLEFPKMAVMVKAGASYAVFRAMASPTLRRTTVRVPVAVITIVSMEGNLGVARVVGSRDTSNIPFLRIRGVLIGDFIYPDLPVKFVEPSPPLEEEKVKPRKVRKGGKGTKGRKGGTSKDKDDYENWGVNPDPIDF
jgi:hypothetical protein